MERSEVWEDGIDDGGVVHLADVLSEAGGFPICGKNYRAAPPGTVPRVVCGSCREAVGRWQRALRIWAAA